MFTSKPWNSTTPDVIALIAGLLRDQLGLPVQPPRVFVYNETWNIPQDTALFLLVSLLDAPVYGAGSGYLTDPNTGEFLNGQQLARSNIVTVDAFSQSTEARARLPEIFFALSGDAMERLVEQNTLKAFRPTEWVDLSALEASRRLNRFQTQLAVYQSSGQTRPVPFMQPRKPYIGKLLVQP